MNYTPFHSVGPFKPNAWTIYSNYHDSFIRWLFFVFHWIHYQSESTLWSIGSTTITWRYWVYYTCDSHSWSLQHPLKLFISQRLPWKPFFFIGTIRLLLWFLVMILYFNAKISTLILTRRIYNSFFFIRSSSTSLFAQYSDLYSHSSLFLSSIQQYYSTHNSILSSLSMSSSVLFFLFFWLWSILHGVLTLFLYPIL